MYLINAKSVKSRKPFLDEILILLSRGLCCPERQPGVGSLCATIGLCLFIPAVFLKLVANGGAVVQEQTYKAFAITLTVLFYQNITRLPRIH
jgi:hypothetical protein